MARHGKAGRGKAWQGLHSPLLINERQGKARLGKARQGLARQGKARRGMARHGIKSKWKKNTESERKEIST